MVTFSPDFMVLVSTFTSYRISCSCFPEWLIGCLSHGNCLCFKQYQSFVSKQLHIVCQSITVLWFFVKGSNSACEVIVCVCSMCFYWLRPLGGWLAWFFYQTTDKSL